MTKKPRFQMFPEAYSVGKLGSIVPNTEVGDFDVTRNSIGTRVNKDGLIEVMDANVPRLDYSDGGCPKLLTEASSTNLIPYSDDFNSNFWISQSGNLSSGGSINGYDSSIKYISTSYAANQMYVELSTALPIDTYSQSGLVKCDDAKYIYFQIPGIESDCFVVWDNVNKITMSIDSRIKSAKLKDVGNGWVKAEITFTSSKSSVFLSLKTYFSNSSSSNVGGIPSGTIAYQTQTQLEQEESVTSYIPTSGATLKRQSDQVLNFLPSSFLNSSNGVLFC